MVEQARHPRGRVLAYALGVASFLLMGLVVYSDGPAGDPGAFAELSEKGREGFAIWREQNCHTCHQLYGFGGYLGPDLTHVVGRVTEGDFDLILRTGVGPMPRGMVNEAGAGKLYAFLREMDRTGQGHPACAAPERTWEETFAVMGSAVRGANVFRERECGTCHRPLRLGRLASPDLTRVTERLSDAEIETSLRRGRGNMPAFSSLSAGELSELLGLLHGLNGSRGELLGKPEGVSSLNWFNYEKPQRR